MQRELLWALLCLANFASACSNGDRSRVVETARTTANRQPAISGSPIRWLVPGEFYDFRPRASDPEGHALVFTIVRKPRWAAFSATSGRLHGTPGNGDVGVYTNITITVSDGRTTSALPAFDIAVSQQGDRSVTLSWMPPTENTDGSVLTDLHGYRIYYGRSLRTLNQSIMLDNPGLTRYVIEGLSNGKWHFAMTSVDRQGNESRPSEPVNKNVN